MQGYIDIITVSHSKRTDLNTFQDIFSYKQSCLQQFSLFPREQREKLIFFLNDFLANNFRDKILVELNWNTIQGGSQNIREIIALFDSVNKSDVVKESLINIMIQELGKSKTVQDLIQFILRKKEIQQILGDFQELAMALELAFLNDTNIKPRLSPETLLKAVHICLSEKQTKDLDILFYYLQILNKNQQFVKLLFQENLKRIISSE